MQSEQSTLYLSDVFTRGCVDSLENVEFDQWYEQSINLNHQTSNCWMVTAKDHKGHQSLLHQFGKIKRMLDFGKQYSEQVLLQLSPLLGYELF